MFQAPILDLRKTTTAIQLVLELKVDTRFPGKKISSEGNSPCMWRLSVHSYYECNYDSKRKREYAATATVPFMSISLRDRLCSVWRRAVRCVAGADWQAEVASILKNHRLRSIEHRWALQFAVVVRRCVQKSAPLSLCTRLSFTEHSHRTRGSGNSFRPFCPSSWPGTLSFTNRAPLVWNSLPASIKP